MTYNGKLYNFIFPPALMSRYLVKGRKCEGQDLHSQLTRMHSGKHFRIRFESKFESDTVIDWFKLFHPSSLNQPLIDLRIN